MDDPVPSENADDSDDKVQDSLSEESDIQRLLADALTYKAPVDDLKIILRCGGDVNKAVKRGLRPLHYAVYVNNTEGIRLIIEAGSDVNAVDEVGYTPMHLCARKGHIESMQILIDNGALVNYCELEEAKKKNKDDHCASIEPLNLAVENNHVNCVKLLLENGAHTNHRYFMGYEINLTPLENVECLELLLQYGADPNVHSRCGFTPLIKACKEGNIAAAAILLKHGACINLLCASRFDNKTALHYAIQSGDVRMADYILRQGAMTSRTPGCQFAPMHFAVIRDRLEMCRLLWNYGAEIDETTDDGCTPLMLACATPGLKHFTDMLEFFLTNGANPNAHCGFYNYTSPCLSPIIEYFINAGVGINYQVTQSLLRHGAKVSIKPASKILRMRDPYGVLQYIGYLEKKQDIFYLILSASKAFDRNSIDRDRKLPDNMKAELQRFAYTPRPLKQLIRLEIRKVLPYPLPLHIDMLPLPTILKGYLLFEYIY